jgi:CheY-like chemotaxis protein/nitrogen-specific signal transduction histidine kinase
MKANNERIQGESQADSGRTQEQLRQENLAKQAALESKSRLIDNMAYQIRTLSNAIIGFSDLLNAEELSSDQKEYVDEIYQAGRALSVLVNDVLDLAKLDSGNLLVVSKTYCDLTDRLEDFYQLIITGARQRGLEFSIVADANVPAHIFTDSERLIKCLLNLTTNAVKYTPKGFVRVSISMQQKENHPWIRFDVQDSGPGIAPERLSSIFNEVAQIEDANRGVLSSLDMGLSITGSLPVTQRMVNALGGRIEVTSQPSQGSTFSLLLPAGVNVVTEKPLDLSRACWNVKQQPQTKTSTGSTRRTAAKEQTRGNILLVEDQESNRTVITLLLETLGVAVETAEDGVQAVEKASRGSFDLILMDLILPNMDGYEAAKILRQKNIAVPIIALSAGVMNEQDSKRIEQDFNALLTKPVDGKKLQQTLRKYLPGLDVSSEQTKTNFEDECMIEYTNG